MKIFFTLTIAMLFSFTANAQNTITPSYIEEMKALGTVSGIGMACGAPKYATFEMLARAILVTKAISDKNQEEGMIAYNTAKADSFLSKQADGLFNCGEINARFNEQKIFKTTLYADGTIKMYDGKVFYPRHPYDATMLKDDENTNRQDAIKIYNEAKQKSKGRKQVAVTEDGKTIGSLPPAPKSVSSNTPQVTQPIGNTAENKRGIGHIRNKKR